MTIRIKIKSQPKINVRTQIATPESLSGVDNVDIDNIRDGYVLMYNDNLQRYSFVDPDVLLSKSVEDDSLPQDFIDKLDEELVDKINFDGGLF
jgi:hypothetical protein